MSSCKHNLLILLPEADNRLRCKHCHLTIKENELNGDYCPECFEMNGTQNYDFHKIQDLGNDTIRYRCEDCGVIIEC